MFLGIDLGTGSVKVLLTDRDGQPVAEASRVYPVVSPARGHAETDPALWWSATVEAVREACAGRADGIDAIGLSGQAHGIVTLDGAGAVLRPAILWPDQRATAQMAEMLALPEALRLPLANPVVGGMAAVSLMWIRDEQPEIFAATRHALSPKDWLRYRMTGALATEPSDASMTLLYELTTDRWSDDLLRALRIPSSILPPLRRSEEVAGHLGAEAAAAMGLRAGIPVGTGLADSAACLLGMGQVEPGKTILQIGSGIQLMALVDGVAPRIQPFYNTFRAAEGTAYLMAASLNGGTAFEWVRGVLKADWDEMYQAAFAVEDAGEVIFLPYASGERAPILDAEASAAFAFMKLGCTRAQVIRSAFDGVALAIRDIWDALGADGVTAPSMLLTGGGTTDPRWRQLLADTIGVPLVPAVAPGTAALGAAYLAGLAVGRWHGARDLPVSGSVDATVMPRPDPGLERRLARFRATYRALKAV